MNIKENISKISWSFLDKVILVLYGFVTIYQIKFMEPEEYGVFFSILQLVNFILSITDSLALNGIIQFGQRLEERGNINRLSFYLMTLTMLILPIIFIFGVKIFEILFNQSAFSNLIYLLPLITILSIPRIFILKCYSRDLKFRDYFFLNFIFYFVLSVITLYLIHIKELSTLNLLYSYIATNMVVLIFLILKEKHYFKFSKGNITFKDYLGFTFPMTLVTLGHSIPKMLDVFIISFFLTNPNKRLIIGLYSASKTLFRLFDQALDASYGLLYPVAIRTLAKNDKIGVQKLFSKAVSFVFVIFLISFLVLQMGLTEIIFKYLPEKYILSIDYFNIMIYSVLILPFSLLAILINADNKPKITFYIVISGAFISSIMFILLCKFSNPIYLPFGIFTYNLVLCSASFIYVKRHYGFPIKLIFRAITDIKNFVKDLKRK